LRAQVKRITECHPGFVHAAGGTRYLGERERHVAAQVEQVRGSQQPASFAGELYRHAQGLAGARQPDHAHDPHG
jgi:hypothetical protein